MGTCKYCGKKAGFFKSVHDECVYSYTIGKLKIVDRIGEAIVKTTDFSNLEIEINTTAQNSYIPQNEIEGLYSTGFHKAVELFLDDGIISDEEEQKIKTLKVIIILTKQSLTKQAHYKK